MLVKPIYKLEVEFATGSFTDITADCFRVNVDRSAATLDQPLSAGAASFLLDNNTGKYSPANSASALYSFLDPGRRTRLSAFTRTDILNPGFENGLTDWSPDGTGGWAAVTNPASAHAGSGFAIQPDNIGVGFTRLLNAPSRDVSSQSTVTVEMYVNATGGPLGNAGVGALFTDNGAFPVGSAYVVHPPSSLNGWTRVRGTFAVPSGAAAVFPMAIVFDKTNSAGAFLFDEASYGEDRYIFSGRIKRYSIQPVAGPRTALIECEDQVGRLLDTEVNLSLYANTNPGSLFVDILSQCNVSSFSVAAFSDAVPFAYYTAQKAASIFDQLVREGAYWISNGPDEVVNVRARNFNAAGTVVASYTEMFGLSYGISDHTVVNVVRAEAQARKQDTTVSTVAWVDPDALTIAAGATSTFWLSYVDPVTLDGPTPANSAVTPVSSLDYKTFTSTGGGGTQRTSVASVAATLFASTAKVVFTNNAAESVYVNKMQIRGYSLRLQPSVATVTEDSSSQLLYRKHEQTYVNETLTDPIYIAAYSQYLLGYYKEPREEVQLSIKNIFPDVVRNELGDLIHLSEDISGINNRWKVIGVAHDIDLASGIEHAASYRLERWNADGTFILDTSQLSTGILGF